jgi:hypothetical protein
MKIFFFLTLIFCFFGITNLFALQAIFVTDTTGIKHRIVLNETKVKLVFKDAHLGSIKGKIVGFENGMIHLKNGSVHSIDLLKEIRLKGGKEKDKQAVFLYYFFAVNATLTGFYLATGHGADGVALGVLVVLITPVTMFAIPEIMSSIIRNNRPYIILMEGNFK